MSLNFRLKGFSRLQYLILIILLLGLTTTVYLVQQQTRSRTKAAYDPITIFFSPASLSIPPEESTKLMVDSRTNNITFLRVHASFDPSLVRLTNEINVTNSPLKTVILKTTMANANIDGNIVLVLAQTPGNQTPLGVFELASLNFSPVSSNPNLQTQILINNQDSQVVHLDTTELSFTSQFGTINVNITPTPSIFTPTPTLTPRPTPTSTLTPTRTPTPTPTLRPTSTPIPTPTPLPLNAKFVSQVCPPSIMSVGQSVPVSVRMKNTGGSTWTSAENYKLGSPYNYWGANRVALTSAVPNGSEYNFAFSALAPTRVGTYYFRWRMVQDISPYPTWFGEYTPLCTVKVVDPIPPTVSLTSPSSGTTAYPSSTLTLQATASDNLGVTKVEFLAGSNFICADNTSPYSCSWKVPNEGNTSWSLLARAYDLGGNVSLSTSIPLRVPLSKTCSVALSSQEIGKETPVTVTLTGNGNTSASNEVRLWLTRQDRTQITGLSPTPSETYYDGYSYRYKISSCTSGGGSSCSSAQTLTLPKEGNYFLYCDITSDPGKCTGDPFCVQQGGGRACADWSVCSKDDHQSLAATSPTSTLPSCNFNEVFLSAEPSPLTVGNSLTFTLTGSASTYPSDIYRPSMGVSSCSSTTFPKTCKASAGGIYTWTHNFRNCLPGTSTCSPVCSETTAYDIKPLTCPQVSLSVSPNPISVGQTLTFTVPSEATTYPSDIFTPSGGVSSCLTSGTTKTCKAFSPGQYTWIHNFRNCQGTTCSTTCSASATFEIR